MSKQTECAHMRFRSQANVFRLSEIEGGPITGYTAEIKIACDDCGLPFRFRVVSVFKPLCPN